MQVDATFDYSRASHLAPRFKRTNDMKTTVSMLLALAMAAAAPAARCDERNFDRALDVSPGGLLTVEADGADVTVTAVEGKQVVVHVKAKGSASVLENMTLSADKSATGVAVVVKRKSGLGNLLHVGFEALDVSVNGAESL